jgi:hypothetical protein
MEDFQMEERPVIARICNEAMRRLLEFGIVVMAFFAMLLIGCGVSDQPIQQNEALRLTSEDVGKCTSLAERGDVDAAMKLWQHYDFAERDHSKGTYWKRRYEELRQKAKK